MTNSGFLRSLFWEGMGGKALGEEVFGAGKDGQYNPKGALGGDKDYGTGFGDKGGKKAGQGLFGEKDDKGSGAGAGKKPGGSARFYGDKDKDDKGKTGSYAGKCDKKDQDGKKDQGGDKDDKSDSGGKKDDTDTAKDKTDDKEKDKKEDRGGGGIGPDPGPEGYESAGADPLGLNPQTRLRERSGAPDMSAVGVDRGEGDRAGSSGSNVSTVDGRNARINPGAPEETHETHDSGPSLIWKMQTYGVDPADTGMQEGMQDAPPGR